MSMKIVMSVSGTVIFDAEIEDFYTDDAEMEIEQITLKKDKIIEYLQKVIKLLKEADAE